MSLTSDVVKGLAVQFGYCTFTISHGTSTMNPTSGKVTTVGTNVTIKGVKSPITNQFETRDSPKEEVATAQILFESQSYVPSLRDILTISGQAWRILKIDVLADGYILYVKERVTHA